MLVPNCFQSFKSKGAREQRGAVPDLLPLSQRNDLQPGGLCLRVVVSSCRVKLYVGPTLLLEVFLLL